MRWPPVRHHQPGYRRPEHLYDAGSAAAAGGADDHTALYREALYCETYWYRSLQVLRIAIYRSPIPSNGNAHNGALVAIDQRNGDILAMVGSVDYNSKDHHVQGANNITTSPLPVDGLGNQAADVRHRVSDGLDAGHHAAGYPHLLPECPLSTRRPISRLSVRWRRPARAGTCPRTMRRITSPAPSRCVASSMARSTLPPPRHGVCGSHSRYLEEFLWTWSIDWGSRPSTSRIWARLPLWVPRISRSCS